VFQCCIVTREHCAEIARGSGNQNVVEQSNLMRKLIQFGESLAFLTEFTMHPA
jgi:hypothetical protein